MKKIYFVVSSTPTSMGNLIRLATHYPYNHISFAFHKDLHDLVSFSRYYYETPFYGGYVNESIERYNIRGNTSNIKVYELEIEELSYIKIIKIISYMNEHPKEFHYNLFSALFHPIHKRIMIYNCFTCEEFCSYLLNKTNLSDSYMTIPEFCHKYENNCIYEGSLNQYSHALPHSSAFYSKVSKKEQFKVSSRLMAKLLYNLKKYKQKGNII